MQRLRLILSLAALNLCTAQVQPARKPAPPTAKRRIDLALSSEHAKSARWGIHVINLKTGATVYEHNAGEHFTPASNTKLFSTALALERLGVDHTFVTTIRANRLPDANGRIDGDLRLVGGADPTLSGRKYPYVKDDRKDEAAPNTLEPIDQLADQLIARGIREITGDIIGDDRLFVWEPFPEGWTIDDAIWAYGAGVSALPFNDSAFTLNLRPGAAPGDLAVLALDPPSIPLTIDNRVLTSASGPSRVQVDRMPGTRHLRVFGTIPLRSDGVRQILAVDDPALYAAHVLYDVLTLRGVVIHGSPAALHRWSAEEPFDPASGVELARRTSPRLLEVARVINKVSQNLHAEMLLGEVARVKQPKPARNAGLEELKAFLTEIGIDEKAYHFEDGSGLSRRTLVTPSAVTKLLAFMNSRSYRADWESLLPIGGDDGSLRNRFEKSPRATAIHAKTGALATASALSGYLTTKRKTNLAFCILANNYTAPAAEIRKVIDRIGLALLDWEGN